MKISNCHCCKKNFKQVNKTSLKKYCSEKCFKTYRNLKKKLKRAENVKVITTKCPECKKQFKQKSNQNKKFCTTKCNHKYQGKKFNKRRLLKIKTDKTYREKFYKVRNKWINENKDKIKIYRKKTQSKPEYKLKRNEYLRKYYKDPKNYERRKELRSIRYWQKGDREKKLEYKKQNKDKIKKQAKEYYKKTKDKIYAYRRNKFKTDPIWVLRSRVRTRFYTYIKRGLAKKNVKTNELIGCNWEFLKNHLEKQFKPKMNWKNYGQWHIDHIKPMSYFDLFDTKQQKLCFHYSNLQPLWAKENLSKGNRFIG